MEENRQFFAHRRFISTCVEKIRAARFVRFRVAVHLHVRGENLHFAPGTLEVKRFISTCVEKIIWSSQIWSSQTVHLHVRGENLIIVSFIYFPYGSSPRAWRKWRITVLSARHRRFISTCVEKISSAAVSAARRAVHLHVRGENTNCIPQFGIADGSSPRAWRKCAPITRRRKTQRFISTCVEKIGCAQYGITVVPVHLHVRGENVRHRDRPALVWRFISTCVEKIARLVLWRLTVTVHLHVRGENATARTKADRNAGSSPRAWRKFIIECQNLGVKRFISTCVEKIFCSAAICKQISVHLHVRGENWYGVVKKDKDGGSSPRAWRKWIKSETLTPEGTVHLHVRGENINRVTANG